MQNRDPCDRMSKRWSHRLLQSRRSRCDIRGTRQMHCQQRPWQEAAPSPQRRHPHRLCTRRQPLQAPRLLRLRTTSAGSSLAVSCTDSWAEGRFHRSPHSRCAAVRKRRAAPDEPAQRDSNQWSVRSAPQAGSYLRSMRTLARVVASTRYRPSLGADRAERPRNRGHRSAASLLVVSQALIRGCGLSTLRTRCDTQCS
jgi:hypothetical protein